MIQAEVATEFARRWFARRAHFAWTLLIGETGPRRSVRRACDGAPTDDPDARRVQRQTQWMRCRLGTLTDVPALANLRWTWRSDEEPGGEAIESREAFIERFSAFAAEALFGRWTVWVAEDEQEIVANIWVYRVPKVPSPSRTTRDFGYMTNVYTVPAMRELGVGSELLDAVTAWAHESDLELIIVWPSERSVPWYSRGGYKPSTEMLELEIAGYEG